MGFKDLFMDSKISVNALYILGSTIFGWQRKKSWWNRVWFKKHKI